MASNGLHRYKISIGVFKTLLQSDPENKKHISWLNNSIYKRQRRTSKVITVSCALLLITEMILHCYKVPFQVQFTISIMLMAGGIGGIIFDYVAKKKFKEHKRLYEN
jgi:hypothetical protein